jgi:hypothetical protein
VLVVPAGWQAYCRPCQCNLCHTFAGASVLALRFLFHSVFHNSTTVLSTTANCYSESVVETLCETSDYLSSDYFDRRRTCFCVDSNLPCSWF